MTAKPKSTRDPSGSYPVAEPGLALDRFLRGSLPGASWAEVRRYIERGKVSVDSVLVTDARRALDPGSVVTLTLSAPRPRAEVIGADALVHVDGAIVVVEKPSGLSTVPFDESERDSLDVRVRDVLFRFHRGPRAPLGVVQRLDKETSGLLVFARTTAAKKHLQQQLRAHSVHRRYLALAHGSVSSTRVRSRLVKNRGDGRRGSTERADLGRLSVTHVRALEALAGATLVECRLETGRTHQIRIHLSELGHPLLGDRVYGHGYQGVRIDAERVMLHAAELGFVHPTTGRSMSFRSEPPLDFRRLLERLRSR